MRLDVDGFTDFAARVTIPSKDLGLVKMAPLWGTQTYWLREVARGLEDGIHDFVTGKGRQIGETTKNDAFRLFWPQVHSGTQGMFVSNSDENRDFRRDVCLEMLASLPMAYRHEVRVNNRNLLAWQPNPSTGFGGSRLMFDVFGARPESDLGRSRGINFLDADEVGLCQNERGVEALRASLSTRHPGRLYLWNGTGNGYNIFYDMVRGAQKAATQRFIFVGWYRHELYTVEEGSEVWEKYEGRLTADEKAWTREVKRREGLDIGPGQVIWYRWQLDEQFYGNEAMRAQEFPCTPDEMFQSFGDRFVAMHHIQRMRGEAKRFPAPAGFEYQFGRTVEDSALLAARPDTATLKVWKDPLPYAAYIIAGHPIGSSSPEAMHWVADVYQAWPDHLEQVAQYSAERGDCTTQEFAWIMLHLAGYYRDPNTPFLVLECQGPGRAVEKHLQLFREHGFGLGSAARAAGVQDFYGAYRHFFWYRPDHLGGKSPTLDLQTNPTERPYFLHMLADAVAREQITIRSDATITSLASLRRGESGDNDQIAGGASQSDAHAMCAMLAVRAWQDQAMGDLERIIPKREQPDQGRVPSMGEVLVSGFMRGLLTTGKARGTRW